MIRHSFFSRRRWLRYSALAPAALAVGRTNASQDEPGGCITDVQGIRVGHFTDSRKPTGCTVILFDSGAVAGVDVRGSAPGTRETDLLQPVNTVERVNAIVLSGGSAFGLDTASGVMRYLEEHGQGYRVGPLVVPIVPAAILFDLNVGDPKIRPDAQAGYAACQAATTGPVAEGNIGAGAGATVGKFFGPHSAMKAGLGTASVRIGETGIVVGAIAAVNAAGDVLDARTGKILAGARDPSAAAFRDTTAQIMHGTLLEAMKSNPGHGTNTTIAVVATNATLTKTELTKVSQMAHDGLARSINPIHTVADGDTVFAAATGSAGIKADTTTIGVAAAETLARAVRRSVFAATGIPGYPAYRDLPANLRSA